MIVMLLRTFCASIVVLWGFAAQAKDDAGKPVAPSPDAVVRLFDGFCADNVPALDRVRSFAQALKWKALPPELAALGAPPNPQATYEGWRVKDAGSVFLVGWSEGRIDGRKVSTCAIFTKDVSADALAALIAAKYKVRPLDDMREAYKRVRAWDAVINGEKAIISLMNPVDAGFEAATLGVVVTGK